MERNSNTPRDQNENTYDSFKDEEMPVLEQATQLRHEIAILESKKRILETLDALGV